MSECVSECICCVIRYTCVTSSAAASKAYAACACVVDAGRDAAVMAQSVVGDACWDTAGKMVE